MFKKNKKRRRRRWPYQWRCHRVLLRKNASQKTRCHGKSSWLSQPKAAAVLCYFEIAAHRISISREICLQDQMHFFFQWFRLKLLLFGGIRALKNGRWLSKQSLQVKDLPKAILCYLRPKCKRKEVSRAVCTNESRDFCAIKSRSVKAQDFPPPPPPSKKKGHLLFALPCMICIEIPTHVSSTNRA